MGDTHRDPTDHSRTHFQHAGEHMIDNYSWPGFLLLAVGIIALVGCVASAAYDRQDMVMTIGLVALAAVAAGSTWIALEHRRVRRIEAQWLAEHQSVHPRGTAA